LTNQRTGTSYYLAQVKEDEAELLPMKEVRMAPGMPALVILPTGVRTALDAAAPPDSLTRVFRDQ